MATDADGQTIRILIVEDEGIIARDLQRNLEELGHQVVGATNSGEEALEVVSVIAVDLVLMDIHLRGKLDGIQTAERVKNDFDIPVVYLTAHADEATLRRATATEPFGYLLKPFTRGSIASAIRVALKRCTLERELQQQRIWLDTILATIGDAVIATDYEGNVQFINTAAELLTGWRHDAPATESLTNAIDLLVDCRDGKSFDLLDLMNARGTRIATAVIRDSAGYRHPVSVCIAPISTGGERISGVVWTLRRLTAAPPSARVPEALLDVCEIG